MSMFMGIDTAASGLTAERLRMDVISNNIANANTTRTANGTAYRRRFVVFSPRDRQAESFEQTLSKATSGKKTVGRRPRSCHYGRSTTRSACL